MVLRGRAFTPCCQHLPKLKAGARLPGGGRGWCPGGGQRVSLHDPRGPEEGVWGAGHALVTLAHTATWAWVKPWLTHPRWLSCWEKHLWPSPVQGGGV